MKKLFALMLALCMMFACTAMAEVIDLAPVVAQLAENGVNGSVVALEKIGMQIYLPEGLVEDANATADEGTELLYAWTAEDGSGDYLKMSMATLEGIETTEDLLNVMVQNGADAKIVDLPCGWQTVVFLNSADNEISAGLVCEGSQVIAIDMGPVAGQEEAASYVFGLIIATLSPIG